MAVVKQARSLECEVNWQLYLHVHSVGLQPLIGRVWDVCSAIPDGCFVTPEPWVEPKFRGVNLGINWEVLHIQLYMALSQLKKKKIIIKGPLFYQWEKKIQGRVGHNSTFYLSLKTHILAFHICAVHSTFQRSGKSYSLSFWSQCFHLHGSFLLFQLPQVSQFPKSGVQILHQR